MGNASSCAPSIITNGVTKVILSNGNLQIYTKPIKAADLMIENQGEFVCEPCNLVVGQRILGLSADEFLERRKLYLLLPMDLLYSVLTHEELSFLSYKAAKALKHSNSNINLGKICPLLISEFCLFPSESRKIVLMEEETSNEDYVQVVRRFSKQRSWKPALETIVEA
ncbi:hypothetical protein ACFE04_009839 [Oxalis oulophora]